MSFHPNEVGRRANVANVLVAGTFLFLVAAFFRTQVVRNERYALQSEENRLREVPLPAPRAIIYDRNLQVIAENVPGYSVSLLSPSTDSLRATLQRLSGTVELSTSQIASAVRRYQRAPNRPTVILSDAPFDVVSVLEEHRVEYPGLIIQSAPKRYYPDGAAVASFIGYTGEITEEQLASSEFEEYKAGQQIGKAGLEKEYEALLRGREGIRFVEVDARGRVVREVGARQDLLPRGREPLRTSIDLDLQRYAAELFGDSLQGGVIALVPATGEVLALHSAPSFDPNRFIGGIPAAYWRELNTDPRRPLYNKVTQGRYPPASTWKLATALIALEEGVATLDDRMRSPCTGGYPYFGRYFRCWEREGHGDVTLARAIEVSCDVYFYQLGLKIGLQRLVAGGVELGFREKSGIDLPNEATPIFPYATPAAADYFNHRYGPRGWTNAVVLNLSIGQGENSQTVANMARFYTALATDGHAAEPHLVAGEPERTELFSVSPAQMTGLRAALAGVVSATGTAGSARIPGMTLAGKTGTAQNPPNPDHAWFVGFAPADDPKIVVAVMLEYGEHGYFAARIASKLIERYLRQAPTQLLRTEG